MVPRIVSCCSTEKYQGKLMSRRSRTPKNAENKIQTAADAIARGECKRGHSSRPTEAESSRDALFLENTAGKEHNTIVLKSMDRCIHTRLRYLKRRPKSHGGGRALILPWGCIGSTDSESLFETHVQNQKEGYLVPF